MKARRARRQVALVDQCERLFKAKSALSGGRRDARTVRHPSELHRGGSGLLGKPSGGRIRKKLAAIRERRLNLFQ